ncbi:DNA polymerase [Acinetobacter sp. Root1280]|uniref:reverse transcriptase family protein n=1 Tax=Acinetobacter sp. Root1280 TaxID=1736444 RepID=UPI0006F928BA|nr:reverse transcriptase family protein [Acinetobacter sp. Root1280]KQW89549.1 DNA polymerase [Acinetobacter sp. Root1280]
METWSLHRLYTCSAEKLGADKATKLKRYSENLKRKNLPTIFTLNHLAKITGVDYHFLRSTVLRNREIANYKMYAIRKRSGGRRHIHSVNGKLLKVQTFINEEILQNIPVSSSSYAFKKNSGIKECAQAHCEAKWIFKFDLENFFYSINEHQVYKIFKDLGYTSLLSFEIAKICTTTRLPTNLSNLLKVKNNSDFNSYRFYQNNYCLGVLPQGSPTSPMLSNLVAQNLDNALIGLASNYNLTYTRYADDLTFSTPINLPQNLSIGKLQREIFYEIRRHGFKENKKKTVILGPGSRKIVLGLLVDTSEPRLSKAMLKRIDRLVYAAHKFGIIEAAEHEGFESPIGFFNHVNGLISFVKHIDINKYHYFSSKFPIFEFDNF